jgi:hypothetical protein
MISKDEKGGKKMKHFSKHALYLTLAIALIVPVKAWSLVDPHCTDGECTAYVEDCWNLGREVMCLDASSNQTTTVCINIKAAAQIMKHYPDACRGTCKYPTVCNN